MSKRTIIILAIAAIFLIAFFLVFQLNVGVVRATELFGDGRMISVTEKNPEDGDLFVGLIYSRLRLFTIHGRTYGRQVQCILQEDVGGAIKDYSGPLPCLIVFLGDGKFSGWVEFRGGHRKLCGARHPVNLPVKCRWEYD